MPRVDDGPTTDYLIRKIPRAFWDQVKAKAENNRPPLNIRYVAIELLRQWVENPRINNPGAGPEPEAIQAALPKPRRRLRMNKGPKPKPKPQPVVLVIAPAEVPDLGSSF